MNSIALGYLIKDEREWLERLLPPMLSAFDGLVAVDTGSTDGTQQFLREHGGTVQEIPWEGSFAVGRNHLITLARERGFQHVLMLDGDEALHPDTVNGIRCMVPDNEARGFPRYNLCCWPHMRWRHEEYPDFQWRLVPLRGQCHYMGQVHECLVVNGQIANGSVPVLEDHIYHYGLCKPPRATWLRHENYRRMIAGLTRFDSATAPYPADLPGTYEPNSEIHFWHPLA